MEVLPVLHNIRSTYNVGAILRTAEGLGINRVGVSGYTPRFNDEKLLPHLRAKLDRQIAKSALGAEKMVTQEEIADLASWLKRQKIDGWTIMGLENNLAPAETERRILLNELDARTTGGREIEKIILVLGEEVEGIPAPIREECDWFLEIPMKGRKESFNVSIAAAIALWEVSKEF